MSVVIATSPQQWRERGHLLLVADGMGAHAAGELASKLAADNIPLVYNKLHDEPPPTAIRDAVREANRHINDRGQANVEFRGMGTTTSVLLLLPQGALVAHVGDSRVYRLRGNRLDQLSFDHSLVWEMMSSGKMQKDDVPSFVPKNIITRSLGPNPTVDVDLEGPYTVEVGDTFLLCSDGLSGQVTDEELGALLACLTPDEAVRALVDLANLRGGPDNITIAIARITDIPAREGVPESWHLPDKGHAPPTPPPAAEPPKSISAVCWTLAAILAASAALLALFGWLMFAVPVAGSAIVLALVAMMAGRTASNTVVIDEGRARFGRGPHRTVSCPVEPALVEELTKVIQEVRSAAEEKEWRIDWERSNQFEQQVSKALAAGRPADAVRASCRAISYLMQEIREQAGRATTPRGAPTTET